MKTTKLTIVMTPDEAFDIANALDFYITHEIESSGMSLESLKAYTLYTEIKLLEHFVDQCKYKLCVYDYNGKRNETKYEYVDDYVKALAKRRKAKAKAIKPEKDL